jgi:hypothetical protein
MAKKEDLDLFDSLKSIAYEGGKGSVGQALYEATNSYIEKVHYKDFIALYNKASDAYFIIVHDRNSNLVVININLGSSTNVIHKVVTGDLPKIARDFLSELTTDIETISLEQTAGTIKKYAQYGDNPRLLRELADYIGKNNK